MKSSKYYLVEIVRESAKIKKTYTDAQSMLTDAMIAMNAEDVIELYIGCLNEVKNAT